MTFNVRNIPAPLVERFWPYAEPYIKRALDHTSGEFRPEDIQSFARDSYIQLWLVNEGNRVVGAVTTEIVTYPNRKHCRVITLAGSKAAEWTGLVDTIIADWARSEGCNAVEAFVRKGYVPVLAKHGFKFKYSVIVKDV
jgi:hypothetical protein